MRLTATRQLQPLTLALGVDWCVAKLVPKLRELYHSGANYQQRITILYAIKVRGLDVIAAVDGAA